MKNKQYKSGAAKVITSACLVLTTLAGLCAGIVIGKADTTGVNTAKTTALAAQAEIAVTEAAVTEPSVLKLSTEFAQSGPYTRAQIVEKCAPSVVGIEISYTTQSSGMNGYSFYYGYGYGYGDNYGQDNETTASGSGVVITEDGYIATCAHVVEKAEKVTVTMNDGTTYDAEIIGTDSRNDIAIIKVEAEGLVAAEIGNSEALVVGEDVIAIGNPTGKLLGTATAGIISATSRTITVEDEEMTLLQTDAAINAGNSGGGLFNAEGQLIGIVNAKVASTGVEGLGFAIPISSVTKEMTDIVSHGYVTGRAYLGVYTSNVTLRSDSGSWRSSRSVSCVQIVDVVAGSAAEKAGLKTGDFILKVNDKEISSNTELSEIISNYNAGDTATLTIQRNGTQSEVEVTFGEYVPDAMEQ